MFRPLRPLLLLVAGSAAALACGGESSNDFGAGDGSAGEPSEGGTAGSSQGGSAQGGSSEGGSGGNGASSQGGSGQGGSPAGGTTSGGASGTSAGGMTTGGAAGADPNGGTGDVGGTGQGGSSGTSGRGGSGGDDCASSVANAQTALQAAQVCNPATDGPKCTGTVEDLCGCTVPVDNPDSEATKNYLRLREPAIRCGVPCLAIPCFEPTTATCGIAGVQAIMARTQCSWLPR